MDVVIPHSLGLWGPQDLVSTPKRLNNVCRYWGWRKICGHYSETNIPQEPGSVRLWAKGTARLGPSSLESKKGRECLHHDEVPAYNVTHEVVQKRHAAGPLMIWSKLRSRQIKETGS